MLAGTPVLLEATVDRQLLRRALKRAAMVAHASQATADAGTRTLQVLLRLPRPVFDRLVGRDCSANPAGCRPGRLGDIFTGL